MPKITETKEPLILSKGQAIKVTDGRKAIAAP